MNKHIRILNNIIFNFVLINTVFFITRLPFFLYFPYPLLGNDSLKYIQAMEMISNNDFTVFGKLPIGYPLFLYLCSLINGKLIFVVIIQMLLTAFTFNLFLKTVIRYFRNYVFVFSILIAVVLIDQRVLQHDFTILTESLYRNLIVIVFILFIRITKKVNKLNLIIFAFLITFISLIRTNGLIIYAFVLYLFYVAYKNKSKRIYILVYMITPFIFFNICWASLNYYKNDIFFIGDAYRVKDRIERISENRSQNNNNLEYFTQIERTYFKSDKQKLPWIRTYLYLSYLSKNQASAFFTKYRYSYLEKMYDDKLFNNLPEENWDQFFNNHKFPLSNAKREIMTSGNIPSKTKTKEALLLLKSPEESNFLLIVNHILYLIHSFIIRNIFICILLLFWPILLLFFKSYNIKTIWIIFSYGLFLMNIFVISFMHGRYIARYVAPYDILLYLFFGFFFYVLHQNYLEKRNRKHCSNNNNNIN